MFQPSTRWRLALNIVIGVVCLLLVTSTTVTGPSGAQAAAATWTGGHRHRGGCLGARLCCPGKNSTCRVQGMRANDRRVRTCYCDTACFSTKDCCADLQLACNIRPVDCVLSAWSDWSSCNVRCGTGIKQRRRSVAVRPQNGGRPCTGPLIEKAVCEGTGCKQPRAPNGWQDAIKETGRIVPASFGSWRRSKRYDPYKDIRKNLFEHYEGHMLADQPQPYCAQFRLTENRRSCGRTPLSEWPKLLEPGTRLCVECQPLVMGGGGGVGRCTGHGVLNRETRWTAVGVPGCRGKWIMTTPHAQCRCPADNQFSFVLV